MKNKTRGIYLESRSTGECAHRGTIKGYCKCSDARIVRLTYFRGEYICLGCLNSALSPQHISEFMHAPSSLAMAQDLFGWDIEQPSRKVNSNG